MNRRANGSGSGAENGDRRRFGLERLGGLVDFLFVLVDAHPARDFGVLGVDRRMDRGQPGGMDPRLLVEILAERVMIFVADDRRGRLGRFEAHVVPAKVLEARRTLAEALGPHCGPGRALAGEQTGRQRCEWFRFAGHPYAPH